MAHRKSRGRGKRTELFGQLIREVREDRLDLAMDAVTARIGVSKGTLSKFENGERVPHLLQLHGLATAYHLSFFGLIHALRGELLGKAETVEQVRKLAENPNLSYDSLDSKRKRHLRGRTPGESREEVNEIESPARGDEADSQARLLERYKAAYEYLAAQVEHRAQQGAIDISFAAAHIDTGQALPPPAAESTSRRSNRQDDRGDVPKPKQPA